MKYQYFSSPVSLFYYLFVHTANTLAPRFLIREQPYSASSASMQDRSVRNVYSKLSFRVRYSTTIICSTYPCLRNEYLSMQVFNVVIKHSCILSSVHFGSSAVIIPNHCFLLTVGKPPYCILGD